MVDIPNTFIQTEVEAEKDKAIIRIRGILVDILLSIAPGVYDEFVTRDKKGAKQLLVQCKRDLWHHDCEFAVLSKVCGKFN